MKIKFESTRDPAKDSIVYRVRIIFNSGNKPCAVEVNYAVASSLALRYIDGHDASMIQGLSNALYAELNKTLTDEEILEQLSEVHPSEQVRTVLAGHVPSGGLARYGSPLPAGTVVPTKSLAPADIEAAKLKIMGMLDPSYRVNSPFRHCALNESTDDGGSSA